MIAPYLKHVPMHPDDTRSACGLRDHDLVFADEDETVTCNQCVRELTFFYVNVTDFYPEVTRRAHLYFRGHEL